MLHWLLEIMPYVITTAKDVYGALFGLAEFIFPTAAAAVLCSALVAGKVFSTPLFWLLLSRDGTASVLSLQPAGFHPHQQAGGGQDLGRGHRQDS